MSMLSPEDDGMLPTEQHSGAYTSLDDYRRGLNQMVHSAKTFDPPAASDEERAKVHWDALAECAFDTFQLRAMLAWAIVGLPKP